MPPFPGAPPEALSDPPDGMTSFPVSISGAKPGPSTTTPCTSNTTGSPGLPKKRTAGKNWQSPPLWRTRNTSAPGQPATRNWRFRNILATPKPIQMFNMKTMRNILQLIAGVFSFLARVRITIGKHIHSVPANTIILFPFSANTCQCGITGIVAVKTNEGQPTDYAMPPVGEMIQQIADASNALDEAAQPDIGTDYLGGGELMENFYAAVRSLKTRTAFYHIFTQPEEKTKLEGFSEQLGRIIDTEGSRLGRLMGRLSPEVVETMSRRIERLKDAGWCLKTELIDNIEKITALNGTGAPRPPEATITTLKNINAILNSIDRLEVRGRDSAGI